MHVYYFCKQPAANYVHQPSITFKNKIVSYPCLSLCVIDYALGPWPKWETQQLTMRLAIIGKLRCSYSYSTSRITGFSAKINSVHEAVNIPSTPSSRWSNCNTWDLGSAINYCMTHISSRKSFHKKSVSKFMFRSAGHHWVFWPGAFGDGLFCSSLTEQMTSSGTWVLWVVTRNESPIKLQPSCPRVSLLVLWDISMFSIQIVVFKFVSALRILMRHN